MVFGVGRQWLEVSSYASNAIFRNTPVDIHISNKQLAINYCGHTLWLTLDDLYDRGAPTLKAEIAKWKLNIDDTKDPYGWDEYLRSQPKPCKECGA